MYEAASGAWSSERTHRHHESLLRELGIAVAKALADGDVTEVMRNPDGELWIDCCSRGPAVELWASRGRDSALLGEAFVRTPPCLR